MGFWYGTVGVLALVIVLLAAKIMGMRKSAREIGEAFLEKLAEDTNTLIDISSRDLAMRDLANTVNAELVKLREQRLRYQQGDLELKSAVTNISHDLRTPLTAICGYLDLLEQEETSESVSRYLAVIRERADLMKELTAELFGYSVILAKEEGGKKEKVDLNRALEESLAAFYTALSDRGIVPTVRMPEEPVVRTLDAAALSRVFSNLLNNAVRYSDGDLDIVLSESGKLTFSNAASGLDEVQVGRLFDRFYTVEAGVSSTGLGLSIARTLTERMGGSILAEYEDGRLTVSLSFFTE